MRVYYDSNYRDEEKKRVIRSGVVSFSDDEKAFGYAVADELLKRGWECDFMGSGDLLDCWFWVSDREEYESFLDDYREAKKIARRNI